MKAKISIFVFMFLLITSLIPQKIQAQEKASGSSATFSDIVLKQQTANSRVRVLRNYLEQQGSPLAPYASEFVAQADYYHIDWKLLVAISGVESTFGKAVPCTNAWGFGIYGDQTLCFTSYNQAIHTISQSLRDQYMNKWGATDVYSIGRLYAASPTWADRVSYFMNQIEAFSLRPSNEPLSISI